MAHAVDHKRLPPPPPPPPPTLKEILRPPHPPALRPKRFQ